MLVEVTVNQVLRGVVEYRRWAYFRLLLEQKYVWATEAYSVIEVAFQ